MSPAPNDTKTLLVVEDDIDDQYFLRNAFETIGFDQHVAYFDTPARLFDYLATTAKTAGYPYAILLDFNMPITNGEETLVQLKENKYYAAINILIYSTSISDEQVKKLKLFGAEGCYIKSNSTVEIVEFAKFLQQKITAAVTGPALPPAIIV